MKNIFTFILFSGILLLAISCVPINELEQSVPFSNGVSPAPKNRYPTEKDSPYFYRMPDGAGDLQDVYYRDRGGVIYLNGFVVGKDTIFDEPGVIGYNEKNLYPHHIEFLPAVDFDNIDGNQNNNQQGSVIKRSGSNSNTSVGNGTNTADPRNKRSGSQKNSYEGRFTN
ncbi:hypothetical protein [Kaistella jeonii]|uniref:Lipoprotein n=1 Tax=Kaistella jeonii TaxID=266749 RepID=A0A0C1F838_9FLAO|nr:hypothetical protein [Kaistella jeonii]KIA88058.1 hypothetical protein OA86_12725 [Kaistella jeonii]SFC31433.1 hypothetical protein SAMN05421876_11340 [Kaistella jeonii]VEI95603.1 Uncharacterised protein [Kaistella jeonii]